MIRYFLAAFALVAAVTHAAAVGLTELPGKAGDGPVTVFYPSSSEARTVTRGTFTFQFAQGVRAPWRPD